MRLDEAAARPVVEGRVGGAAALRAAEVVVAHLLVSRAKGALVACGHGAAAVRPGASALLALFLERM